MMTTRITFPPAEPYTVIARRRAGGDDLVGFVAQDGQIYRIRWQEGIPVGRVDSQRRVFRYTQHDERELGAFTASGQVHSHGLFEGGPLGWLDPDGTVIQAGLIFGEEEVGFVEGPNAAAGAAALLLLFLPDEQEQQHQRNRG
jgi:hypothetical protein